MARGKGRMFRVVLHPAADTACRELAACTRRPQPSPRGAVCLDALRYLAPGGSPGAAHRRRAARRTGRRGSSSRPPTAQRLSRRPLHGPRVPAITLRPQRRSAPGEATSLAFVRQRRPAQPERRASPPPCGRSRTQIPTPNPSLIAHGRAAATRSSGATATTCRSSFTRGRRVRGPRKPPQAASGY